MNQSRPLLQTFKQYAIILGSFVLLLWAIEIIDRLIFGGALDAFGIRPRSVDGLSGILFAPLLHGGFRHVAANSIPFFVLGLLILGTRRLPSFVTISLIIVLVSGLGTWLIGPRFSVHIGASGLVFGYLGFLLSVGYFERSWQSLGLGLVVLLLYGGLIWGILPQGGGISWQTHLFGFIGGVIAANWLSQRLRP